MIDELARIAGIAHAYTDFYGRRRTTAPQVRLAMLQALGYAVRDDADAAAELEAIAAAEQGLQPVYVVPASAHGEIDCGARNAQTEWCLEREDGTAESGAGNRCLQLGPLEPGYHLLTVNGARTVIAAVPKHAFVPPELAKRKLWGISAQLYSLRSETNWGIGDFGDLAELARVAEEFGCATVALNPLHELHLTNASSASPYSPLSRTALNVLYIDAAAAARRFGAVDASPGLAHALNELRQTPYVDYTRVSQIKIAALRDVYAAFTSGSSPEESAAFAAFRKDRGPALERLAAYEALMQTFKERDASTYGWMQFPAAYQHPDAPAVAQFVQTNAGEVGFYAFLQWIADEQLADAARAGSSMPIGLYRDLAVGVDANSADVWADRDAFCLDLRVGAPPDPLNTEGQDWSLPPLNPRTLRERAYAPYIALLRANMRYAGALRIDHVMGLMRLFCIPRAMAPSEGTYLSYRLEEMLGILALESMRNQCMVVGEDLGTVAPGFRERLAECNIFGCRVLYFERDEDGRFLPPERYTAQAVASTGTHDLPPLAGFWSGADIEQRAAIRANSDAEAADRERRERAGTRRFLLAMLMRYGELGTENASSLAAAAAGASQRELVELLRSAYRMLARSNARLLLVQLEDVLVQHEQINVPGTFDEAPNWRRKVTATIRELAQSGTVRSLLEDVDAGRDRGTVR